MVPSRATTNPTDESIYQTSFEELHSAAAVRIQAPLNMCSNSAPPGWKPLFALFNTLCHKKASCNVPGEEETGAIVLVDRIPRATQNLQWFGSSLVKSFSCCRDL